MPRHHDDESPLYQLPPALPHAPDNPDLQVPPSMPQPFMAGRPVPPVPHPFMVGISAPQSQSAQADFPATGHSGASSLASPCPPPSSDSPLPAGRGAGGEDLRERAYTLYCQGLRSDTIAARLGVPARTVRRWLQRTRKQLLAISADERISELFRAIEGQRAVIAAAWAAYEREHRLEDEILAGRHDYLRRRICLSSQPASSELHAEQSKGETGLARHMSGEVLQEEYDRPHRYNTGARYLAVIIAAQREIARLEYLYDEIASQPPLSGTITIIRRPDGPENIPPPRPGDVHLPSTALYDTDEEESDEDIDDDHADDGHPDECPHI